MLVFGQRFQCKPQHQNHVFVSVCVVEVLKTSMNHDLLQRGEISDKATHQVCGVFQVTSVFYDGEVLQTEQK